MVPGGGSSKNRKIGSVVSSGFHINQALHPFLRTTVGRNTVSESFEHLPASSKMTKSMLASDFLSRTFSRTPTYVKSAKTWPLYSLWIESFRTVNGPFC